MKKIILLGSSGRMGQEVKQQVSIMQKEYYIIEECDKDQIPSNKEADVIIDFSSHLSMYDNIQHAANLNIPILICTTGYKEINMDPNNVSIPIMFAPNTNLNMHIFIKLLKDFSNQISEYDVSIIEKHHKHKKDTPSGTALWIKDNINHDNINIASVRASEIFGIHEIDFYLNGERFYFKHEALSRSIFAKGALSLASWLLDKKPSIYFIKDYI